jgi:ribosomal protein S18 acetylase RimI-like enzyme
MKIRKANKKDIEQIVELNSKLGDYHVKFDSYYKKGKDIEPYFRKYLKKIITKRNSRIIVAEENKKIIGFIFGSINNARFYAKPKRIGSLHTAFVLGEYRNLGAGKAMLDDFIGWLKKKKIKNIELSVDFRNKIGNKAWKRFGFKDFMKRMRLDL